MSIKIPTIDFQDLFKNLFADVKVVYSHFSNKLGDIAMDAKDVLEYSKGMKRVSLIDFENHQIGMAQSVETLVSALLSYDGDYPARIGKAIANIQEWEEVLKLVTE